MARAFIKRVDPERPVPTMAIWVRARVKHVIIASVVVVQVILVS